MFSGPRSIIPALSLLALLALGPVALGRSGENDPPRDFQQRIERYMDLREKLEEKAPKLKVASTPERIRAHERFMQMAIAHARPKARRGDLLGPVEDHIREVARRQLKGAEGRTAREKIREGNPRTEGSGTVELKVNAPYPHEEPLATTPPALLRNLPKLPEDIQFRFVGKHLILLDAEANVVLDYLLNLAP